MIVFYLNLIQFYQVDNFFEYQMCCTAYFTVGNAFFVRFKTENLKENAFLEETCRCTGNIG